METGVIPDVAPDAAPDVVPDTAPDVVPDIEPLTPPIEDTDDFWQEILKHTKSDPSLYPLLSNSSDVQAQKTDNELILRVAHPLTAMTIKSSTLLEEAVRKVFNRDIRIRVENVD